MKDKIQNHLHAINEIISNITPMLPELQQKQIKLLNQTIDTAYQISEHLALNPIQFTDEELKELAAPYLNEVGSLDTEALASAISKLVHREPI